MSNTVKVKQADLKKAFKVALKKANVQTQGKVGTRQGCVSNA